LLQIGKRRDDHAALPSAAICSPLKLSASQDQIQKLDGLKKARSISDAEFARLRARLVSNEGGALAA